MDTVKLVKLIPLLSSPVDGEVIGTVRAIGRILEAQKKSWHDLAAALGNKPADPEPVSEPDFEDYYAKAHEEAKANKERKARSNTKKPSPVSHHVRVVMACRDALRSGKRGLSHREASFLDSMLEWTGEPTERQWDWLDAIANKLGFDADDI